MKRFMSVLAALFMLSLAVCGAAFAEEADIRTFTWDGTVYSYESGTLDKLADVVDGLSQYVSTDGADMSANRLFFIHYLSAEKDGQQLNIGRAVMNLPLAQIRFIVNGIEYIETGVLMSSGRGVYLTCLIVPADTADDAEVSIEYRP